MTGHRERWLRQVFGDCHAAVVGEWLRHALQLRQILKSQEEIGKPILHLDCGYCILSFVLYSHYPQISLRTEPNPTWASYRKCMELPETLGNRIKPSLVQLFKAIR